MQSDADMSSDPLSKSHGSEADFRSDENPSTPEVSGHSVRNGSLETTAAKVNGELGKPTKSALCAKDENLESSQLMSSDESGKVQKTKSLDRKLVEYDQASDDDSEPIKNARNSGPINAVQQDEKIIEDETQKSDADTKIKSVSNSSESKSDDTIIQEPDKSSSVAPPSPIKGILKKRRASPPPLVPEIGREATPSKRKAEQKLREETEAKMSEKKRGRRREPSESADSSDGVGRHSLRHRPNQSPAKVETPHKVTNREKEKRGRPQKISAVESPPAEDNVAAPRQKRTRSTSGGAAQESDSSASAGDTADRRQTRNKRGVDVKTPDSSNKLKPPPRNVNPTGSSKGSNAATPSPRGAKVAITPRGSGKPAPNVTHPTPRGTSGKTPSRGGKKSSPVAEHASKLYDSDDFDDAGESSVAALLPLKYVHVARGAFNDLKYTKAAEEVDSPKYVGLSKSVEERRSQVFKSPQSTPSMKFTSSSDPKSSAESSRKSRGSEASKKNSLSPGQMGDISSFEMKSTKSLTGQSSDEKFSQGTQSSKGSRNKSGDLFDNPTPEGHAGRKSTSGGSPKRSSSTSKDTSVLFGDVAPKVCDDFDAEDFLDQSKSSASKKSAAGRRKRARAKRDVDQDADDFDDDDDFYDEEADDLKVVDVDDRSPPQLERGVASKRPLDRPTGSPSPVARKKRSAPQVTPKRREPELIQLTPEDQLTCDFPPDHHLLPGARILAKWSGNFYPGNIVLNLGLGRYKVRFLDGIYRDMPQPDIIPLAKLKPGNALMLALKTNEMDDELQPVTIISTPSAEDSQEWYGGLFEVRNTVTNQDEKVPWEKFIIDYEQRKSYVASLINVAAQDIVLDNISDTRTRVNRGKRVESPPPFEEPAPLPPSRAPRTPKSAAKQKRQSPTKAAQWRPTGLKASDFIISTNVAEEEFEDRSGIFAGSKFVLTSANRVKTAKDSTDYSEEEKPLIPFNKKHVRQMIDEFSGQVVDDFGSLGSTSDCYLIADQYYRTHKYLSALARAVPCLSHMWVHDCTNAYQKLPHKDYALPAGQSLETNEIVEWHQECPRLLSGLKVFVYTQNRPTNPGALDFVQIWAPLVKCMGATLLPDLPDSEQPDAHLDVLLTDVSCPDDVLSRAVELGANAVSSEWLIQAIITGSRPEPDAHPKYRYDYVEQNLVG